jgi:serine protease Do
MRSTLTSLAFFLTALAGAVLIYALLFSRSDQYGLAELVKKQPLPAETTIPPGSVPESIPGSSHPPKKPDLDLLSQFNNLLSQLTESVVPSVVAIDTSTTVDQKLLVPNGPLGLFGYVQRHERYRRPGLGSGFIVSTDGYVVTNHHVVAGVDEIQVTTHEGQTYKAEWVGSDPIVDIAILRIIDPNKKSFPALEFGNSDQTRVGEMVLAVGNPFGLSETVTKGIISAKQRQLSDGANQYLQTDTVINPGNSGGPLINVQGEVIGVNVALFTGQQNVRVWQGVGLAVPSNEVQEVFEAIVHNKPLIRGYLGVNLEDVTPYIARQVGMQRIQGGLVTKVAENSPAAKAGLRPGDIILSIDGRPGVSATDLLNKIRGKDAGSIITLEIQRGEKTQQLSATVSEKPDNTSITMRGDTSASGQSLARELGIKVRDLSPQEKATFGLAPESSGVLVTDVDPKLPAATRLQKNDLIHSINRTPVYNVDGLYQLLGSLPDKQQSVMTLTRDGVRFYAVLNPGK